MSVNTYLAYLKSQLSKNVEERDPYIVNMLLNNHMLENKCVPHTISSKYVRYVNIANVVLFAKMSIAERFMQ